MCVKPINFDVTFIHRLQKLWGEKADGWEKTEPNQVGNNLPSIDHESEGKRRKCKSCSQNLYKFSLLLPCMNLEVR